MPVDGGYSADYILDAVAKANEAVIEGNALYEQDGIAYRREHNNYELLFALLYIYSNEKRLSVCDFGGALGSTWNRYKNILPPDTKWCVVEQPNYVDYGKKNINDIAFYYSLDECDKNDVNVILFSSSLQYLPNPCSALSDAGDICKYILIDETPFQKGDRGCEIYIQHVPSEFYGLEAFYPVRVFNRNKFIESMGNWGFVKNLNGYMRGWVREYLFLMMES